MSSSVSPSDAAYVRQLVYKRAAIVLDDDKQYLIETRLEQAARTHGVESPALLVSGARGGSLVMENRIVEAITTHETSFFRDHHPFEAFRRQVLPALVAAREKSRTLTIWSAACSSGQEPYSLAMLVREHFPNAAPWIRIVATDLSEQILARARAGEFRQIEVNRGLPAPMLVKYFDKEGTSWIIRKSVRDLIEFRTLNLLGAWNLFPRPDVVFLRNVLIYFDAPTKGQIIKRVRTLLPPDGALFLGTAETPYGVDDGWDRVSAGPSTFFRVRP